MKIIKSLFYILFIFLTTGLAWADTVCFECHDKTQFSDKVVHSPVAQGKCTVCHNPHVAKYKNLLQKNVQDLCYSCHENQAKGEDRSKVHKPVREGNCLACHDPHSAKFTGLLKENQPGENCYSCHEELVSKFKVTHRPFAKGQCTACHAPHQSDNIQLLKGSGDQLCRSCHSGNLRGSHKNFPADPGACLTCHSPHGSDRAALIRNVLHPPFAEGCDDCHGQESMGVDLCLDCHENVGQQMQTVHSHLSSKSPNSCVNCHSPHAADTEKLFRNKQHQVCRSCHSDTFAVFIDKKHQHPDTLSCSNCHEGHGSMNLAMLKGGGIVVCSGCHETQGTFTHPVGDGVVDPRTGQSLSCVSCHYPHGTDHENNLKADPGKDLCVVCHQGYF